MDETHDGAEGSVSPLGALFGRLAGLGRAARSIDPLALLFPPRCAACDRLVARHGALCVGCWQTLRHIERPYCDVLGTPFSVDLGAGTLSAEAIAHPPPFSRLRAPLAHEGAARSLAHALKYNDRTDLAPMMARWMLRASDGMFETADAIVPVPLHRRRLFMRQYNQSAELARALSRLTGKPVIVGALERKKATRRQVGLGRQARIDNLSGAFRVTGEGRAAIFGQRIVLVDDVATTGATVASATRALLGAGAAEVSVLTFAMALADTI